MTAFKRFFQIKESGILLALIVMCVGLSVTTSTFLTQYNIGVVIRQASFVAIVALGETLSLIDWRHRSLSGVYCRIMQYTGLPPDDVHQYRSLHLYPDCIR